MVNRLFKVLVVGVMSIVISACSTIDGVQPSDAGVIVNVANKSYAEVWSASVNAMSKDLTVVKIDKDAGVIKSEARPGLATWGEVIGVFIKPSSTANNYVIQIVSKKRLKPQITGQDWTLSIAERIKADLSLE